MSKTIADLRKREGKKTINRGSDRNDCIEKRLRTVQPSLSIMTLEQCSINTPVRIARKVRDYKET